MKTITFKIIVKTPTVYTLNALNSFGISTKKHLDGSYTAEQSFDTESEAKQYLKDLAIKFYEDNANDYIDHIERYGTLSYDGAYAIIEEETQF